MALAIEASTTAMPAEFGETAPRVARFAAATAADALLNNPPIALTVRNPQFPNTRLAMFPKTSIARKNVPN